MPKYDASLYACERLEAPAQDGVKVPISLVYRHVPHTFLYLETRHTPHLPPFILNEAHSTPTYLHLETRHTPHSRCRPLTLCLSAVVLQEDHVP